MPTRFSIKRIHIQEKYARSQLEWNERKEFIERTLEEVSHRNIFAFRERGNAEYNIATYFGRDDQSLALIPLDGRRRQDLLRTYERLGGPRAPLVTHQVFRLGHIDRSELLQVFDEGRVNSLWRLLRGERPGLLSATTFGIFYDEAGEEIYIIYEGGRGKPGLEALRHYLEEKANGFQTFVQHNTVKFVKAEAVDDFEVREVQDIFELELGIRRDIVQARQEMEGDQDVLLALVQRILPPTTAPRVKVSLAYGEEGGPEAVREFSSMYSAWREDMHDQIGDMLDNFKVRYENVDGEILEKNFKRIPTAHDYHEIENGELNEYLAALRNTFRGLLNDDLA